MNDLCEPADLAHLPGATFTELEVDAAVAKLRYEAGWHIAPERPSGSDAEAETVVLDVQCGESWLRLPTRKLVSVDEIRDTKTDTVIDPDTYKVSLDLCQVYRPRLYWPNGYGRVEVDFTHGYEVVPSDLLPVIAALAVSQRLIAVRAPVMDQPAKIGEGVGGYAVTDNGVLSGALEYYSLRCWRPGMA